AAPRRRGAGDRAAGLRPRHPARHPRRSAARPRRELMTTTATTSHTHRAIADGATSALRLDGVSVTYPDGRHADGTIRSTTALPHSPLPFLRRRSPRRRPSAPRAPAPPLTPARSTPSPPPPPPLALHPPPPSPPFSSCCWPPPNPPPYRC